MKTLNTQSNWPYGDNSNESNLIVNQRMVQQLVSRTGTPADRSLQALGIEVDELRESMGLTLGELSQLSGLDRGFLAILIEGKALPAEVTRTVLGSLSVALADADRDICQVEEFLDEAMRM